MDQAINNSGSAWPHLRITMQLDTILLVEAIICFHLNSKHLVDIIFGHISWRNCRLKMFICQLQSIVSFGNSAINIDANAHIFNFLTFFLHYDSIKAVLPISIMNSTETIIATSSIGRPSKESTRIVALVAPPPTPAIPIEMIVI